MSKAVTILIIHSNELPDPTLNFFIMTIENARLFMYLSRVGSVKCCYTGKKLESTLQ